MTTASLDDVGAPGATVQFSVEPILLEMEGDRYVGPLLSATLADLVSEGREETATAAVATAKTEEGAEARVGVAPASELEEPEMP